jgi:hypothetical protein
MPNDNFAADFASANDLIIENDNSSLNDNPTVPPVVPPVTPPVVPPVVPPVTPPVVPPVVSSAVPPVVPPTAQSFDELLTANSKGKYKKLEDIETAINEGIKTAFVNDKVAKLNDYMKAGGKFEDFARTQLTDYTKLDEVSKIKERLRITESYLTDDEINTLVDAEYSVAEDATDREKQLMSIKKKKAAAEAEVVLLEHQKKWAVSEVSPEEAKLANEVEFEKWKTAFHTSVDSAGKIEVSIGDKEPVAFSYEVPADSKASVKEKYTQLSNFWNRYTDDKGNEDVAKLTKDLFILENFEKIANALGSFMRTKGREDVINERKQPGYVAPTEGVQDSPLTIEEQIAAEFEKTK